VKGWSCGSPSSCACRIPTTSRSTTTAPPQLNVEGSKFASGVSDASGTVPRYGESVVTIPVTVPAMRMAIGALQVINGKYRGTVNYDLEGKLDGSGFSSVRFTSDGQLDLSGLTARGTQ
jgi:hypothetical protein